MTLLEIWQAREQLWPPGDAATIAKISVLSSRIAWLTQEISKAAAQRDWMMLAHAPGLVTLHMRGDWSGYGRPWKPTAARWLC